MRHIKLYEEYEDLLSDLQGIGAHGVDFDFWVGDTESLQQIQKKEEDYAKNWQSEVKPNVFVTKVEGALENDDSDWAIITLNNGTVIDFSAGVDDKEGGFKESFKVNGKEYIDSVTGRSELEAGRDMGYLGWILTRYDEILKKGL